MLLSKMGCSAEHQSAAVSRRGLAAQLPAFNEAGTWLASLLHIGAIAVTRKQLSGSSELV
jgi:hypothetical protein